MWRKRMSVGFIRSNFARKVVSVVCLLVFPAAAQQANTGLSMQAVQSGSQQPGAPSSNAPEPKNLPQPTHVDYSKPSPLLPNPFARYIPRNVPPPSFTNAPKIEQLIQNGKLMLSMNDAIAFAFGKRDQPGRTAPHHWRPELFSGFLPGYLAERGRKQPAPVNQ